VLGPYDLGLRQLTSLQREAWGDRVAAELTDRFPSGTVLWFHAGALYCDNCLAALSAESA
jgi:hypothetical protein